MISGYWKRNYTIFFVNRADKTQPNGNTKSFRATNIYEALSNCLTGIENGEKWVFIKHIEKEKVHLQKLLGTHQNLLTKNEEIWRFVSQFYGQKQCHIWTTSRRKFYRNSSN